MHNKSISISIPFFCGVFLLGWLFSVLGNAEDRQVFIYHDADYSHHKAAAESIYMGFYTALSEIDHTVSNYTIKILKKDHRGNSKRSLRTMQNFLKDKDALLILGGLHSSPYIKYRKYINENKILLLVPWAAGGPITRYKNGKNWVFRLSIDDTKAGQRMAQFAINNKGCRQPHLLLEETAWGKNNLTNLNHSFEQQLGFKAKYEWFPWGTRFHQMKSMIAEANRKKSDCIIFVGNAVEGEQLIKAMAATSPSKRLPIISHWGITGGRFHKTVPHNIRKQVDLSFLQTCYSFLPSPQTTLGKEVLSQASLLFPDSISNARDIKSPPGFIHGYDLGKILIAALSNVDLSNNMNENRVQLHERLESLNEDIEGLIKTYNKPFSSWTASNPDAHEALGSQDICIGSYHEDDSIQLLNDFR